jgi:hypothetical protein
MPYGTVNADVIQTSTSGGILGAGNASIMKNRIINGAMVINQRGFSGAITNTSDITYTLDRWCAYGSQASKFTVAQSSTAPTGFNNSLLATSSSAYSITSTDVFFIQQRIEGFNTADLGWGTASAKTVTLSFQVYSSLTGTFGGALQNSQSDRSYPFSYTVSSANTRTSVSVTIAGDTAGAWIGATNGIGIRLNFGLGVGSSSSGTAGAWASANYYSATGATSVVGTNGATFYITGVQLEVGSSATGFEYVNYQTSLANCQRYYWQMITGTDQVICSGTYFSATTFIGSLAFPVTMRTAPSLSYTANTGYYVIYSNSTSDSVNSFISSPTTPIATNIEFNAGDGASGTVGYGGQIRSNTTSSRVGFTAEL